MGGRGLSGLLLDWFRGLELYFLVGSGGVLESWFRDSGVSGAWGFWRDFGLEPKVMKLWYDKTLNPKPF